MNNDELNKLPDREIMIKLIQLIDFNNSADAERDKKKEERRQARLKKKLELQKQAIEKKETIDTEQKTVKENTIKSDINKMLEKPKKKRKTKIDEDEYGEIDDEIENGKPKNINEINEIKEKEYLQVEPIKPIIKEKSKPSKLFKEDLLMAIDPNERKKVIENTKNTLVNQSIEPIKEDQAKQNINRFLTTYSKNKKY